MLIALRRIAPIDPAPSSIGFYLAQLAELEREQGDGLIPPIEYAAAHLEVTRRLLRAAAGTPSEPTASSRRWPVCIATAIVPVAALLLYLRVGSPALPAAPLAPRLARDRAVIANLTEQLGDLSQDPQRLWRAEVMIGSAESDMAQWSRAVAAWKAALAINFDPTLAAQTAEAETEAHGKVTPEAAALFGAALSAAPVGAPWRAAAEARLRQAAQPGR